MVKKAKLTQKEINGEFKGAILWVFATMKEQGTMSLEHETYWRGRLEDIGRVVYKLEDCDGRRKSFKEILKEGKNGK